MSNDRNPFIRAKPRSRDTWTRWRLSRRTSRKFEPLGGPRASASLLLSRSWLSLVAILWCSTGNALGQSWPHPQTTRLSVGNGTQEGDQQSLQPSATHDGRFVAFTSSATNLVSGDTNAVTDVFLRDRSLETTTRISLSTTGGNANGSSFDPSISADGLYVAFESAATNLVSPPPGGVTQIYLRNLQSGGSTVLVSRSSAGTPATDVSHHADVSGDGRYVVYISFASNLIAGDTNNEYDVFVFDRDTATTARVSTTSSGAQGPGAFAPAISDDGRYVAFSAAGGYAGPADPFLDHVYVKDRVTGTTTLASGGLGGAAANGSAYSPAISGDGRWVAFASWASNLVTGDTNNRRDTFLWDRVTGTTILASRPVDVGSLANGHSSDERPALSADGRYLAYVTPASNLLPLDPDGFTFDTNNLSDVYVFDRIASSQTLISVNDIGVPGNDEPIHVDIAGDASLAVWDSEATNLDPPDTNGRLDVFGRAAQTSYTPYCLGDGSGPVACPCNNFGAPGHGCENSFATGGALLVANGSTRVSADTLTLYASGMPTSTTMAFFQGDAQFGLGGSPVVFGDGLRCVAGTLVRLATRSAVAGAAALGSGVPGDGPVSQLGFVPAGGATRYYDAYYRNVAAYCTSATENMSNAIRVVWSP